jgi:hypothetical protein
MLNNEPAPLSRNVFPQQSNTPNGPQPSRGVRPDKPRPQSARTASPQPASLKKEMRAHAMESKSPRSHNHSTAKRKTVKLTLWVKPGVRAEVERLAEREGLSLSATGAAFLEHALQAKVDMQYGSLLQPIIEQAIKKQMRGISTRLAWLLVRVAFDSGQTRSLVTNILGRQPGVTPDILKTILDNSSKTAKGNITRKTPQLTELIEAVERWIGAEEGEK